jgi:hypothetical protein
MRTVKFTGTVTLVLVEGDGNAAPADLANVTSMLAVGAGFQLDVDPDRAPEVWMIGVADLDPASAVIGDTRDLVAAAIEPPVDPAPQV